MDWSFSFPLLKSALSSARRRGSHAAAAGSGSAAAQVLLSPKRELQIILRTRRNERQAMKDKSVASENKEAGTNVRRQNA
jgi:hypothetical protein